MKKIVVKSESCIGCGACMGIDPEHFEFSEDGFSTVKSHENLDSPLLADAMDACPVAIIGFEESDSKTLEKEDISGESNCEDSECQCDCECEDGECECECEDCDCHKED